MEQIPSQPKPLPQETTEPIGTDMRENFRKYLKPKGEKKGLNSKTLAPLLSGHTYREIFTEAWTEAIGSAQNANELEKIISLGSNLHKDVEVQKRLRERVIQLLPGMTNSPKDFKDVEDPTQLLPEYDSARHKLAEQLEKHPDWLSTRILFKLAPFIPTESRTLNNERLVTNLRKPHIYVATR
ncbi:MAG: hypothetical protein Q7R51_02185 [bacterium]|nr:hypothetical protein [bacterium]